MGVERYSQGRKKKKKKERNPLKIYFLTGTFAFKTRGAKGGMVVNNGLGRLSENNMQCCLLSSKNGKAVILQLD